MAQGAASGGGQYGGPARGARDGVHQPLHDMLDHKLTQLQKLIDSGRTREARALADSLRETILRPTVAQPLRRRGVAMIKQVYLEDGDKDALLAVTEDEVALLEGALIEAAGGRPLALR
jgi:hypothetical protein